MIILLKGNLFRKEKIDKFEASNYTKYYYLAKLIFQDLVLLA